MRHCDSIRVFGLALLWIILVFPITHAGSLEEQRVSEEEGTSTSHKSEPIKQIEGNMTRSPSRQLVAPDFKEANPRLAKVNPIIESVFTVPLGALNPNSRLYLKGKYFGKNPGKILMYRYSTPIELINVDWANENNVSGIVPNLTKDWKNQLVEIKIKTADKRYSAPKQIKFVSREEAWLSQDDVWVRSCSFDSSTAFCNRVKTPPDRSCDAKSCGSIGVSNTYDLAVVSRHCQTWGHPDTAYGVDKYGISLKNGWVFKGIEYYKAASAWSEVSLDDPWPRFPTGQSEWNFEYRWEVTPNDALCYGLKIKVEGPVGTTYK